MPPITANQVDLVHCITLNPLFKDTFDGWAKHISSNPLQLAFRHAGSYIMEEFEVLMKRRTSRKEDIWNARLVGFEVICCWEHTIRLTPVKEYHQKSNKATADKLRRLTTCIVTARPEDRQFKAYAIISLGHAISRFINKTSDWKKLQSNLILHKI